MDIKDLRPAKEFARMYGIYAIYNKSNHKMYIGSAVDLANRCNRHKNDLIKNCHPNKHLQAAWNIDAANFSFLKIELVLDKNNLLEREQYYIDAWKPKYNKRLIANSNLGLKWSDETKALMSAKSIGHKRNLGKKRSIQEKENASIRMKGKIWTKEEIQKRTSKWTGKPRPEKVRKILAEKSKGNKNALGHTVSKEARNKIGQSNKKLDKWPCPDGSKCLCKDCKAKRKLLKQQYYLKRKAT